MAYLPCAVSAVHQDVSAGGIRGRIAGEVDIGTLQLLGLGIAAHGDHRLPEILGLLVDEVGETSVDVAGGDAVDAGKVSPLVGEGLGQVDAPGLGDIVGGLLLRVVGDMAGHGSGDDEASGLAFLEVVADGFGAVEGSVEIGVDDLLPVLDGGVEDTVVGGPAGVGDEDIDLAEVFDDALDEFIHVVAVTDVAFISFGLDTEFLT